LDNLIWAALALAFHGLAFCRLVWDERSVRFASEDEEQLWRFFHRRSGMGRLEMKQVWVLPTYCISNAMHGMAAHWLAAVLSSDAVAGVA
jgi:hypothetical protein